MWGENGVVWNGVYIIGVLLCGFLIKRVKVVMMQRYFIWLAVSLCDTYTYTLLYV